MRSSREKPQEIVPGLAFVREFGRNLGAKFELRAFDGLDRIQRSRTSNGSIPFFLLFFFLYPPYF